MRSKNRQGSVMLKIAVFTGNSPNPAGIPVASMPSASGHKTTAVKKGRTPDRHTDQGAAPDSTPPLSDKEKSVFRQAKADQSGKAPATYPVQMSFYRCRTDSRHS